MITRQEERKQERSGILISAIIHGALLILVLFITVFNQPEPPLEGMGGVDLNFGFDDQGMGDNNSMDPVAADAAQTEASTENTQAAEPDNTLNEELDALSTNETSENIIPEKQTTKSDPVKQQPDKQTQTNSQQTSNKQNTYNTGDGVTGQKGNQGNPQGTLDAKNYYGQPGSGNGGGSGDGNGSSLEMNGWHWLKKPKVDDASNETGKIVFKIKVDEDGNLVSVVPIEKQVSDAVVKKYEEAIWKTEFEKNRDNSNSQPFSTGSITFIIRKN